MGNMGINLINNMKFNTLAIFAIFVISESQAHKLSAFASIKSMDDEADEGKISQVAKKLGIPMTPDLMQLGSPDAISNALIEIAVGMGKSEEEIVASLG